MTEDTEPTDEPADEQPDDELAGAFADAAAAEGEPADGGGATDAADAGADVREYLLKGALVMLVVLGVVATLQFYLSAQTAIRRLASDQFRPAFVAGFNLVVLLAVGIGIAQVARRMD